MDDGKWTNPEVRSSLTILICLLWFAASAPGTPPKEVSTPPPDKSAGEKEPTVFAESAAVIDSFTGDFLYLKNENAHSISGELDQDINRFVGDRSRGSR